MLQERRHFIVDLSLKLTDDGFVKFRDDPLHGDLHIALIPGMRRIEQFLLYDNGEGRRMGFLHEVSNLEMIACSTECVAAVPEAIIFERLKNLLHLRRYLLERTSTVFLDLGQQPILIGQREAHGLTDGKVLCGRMGLWYWKPVLLETSQVEFDRLVHIPRSLIFRLACGYTPGKVWRISGVVPFRLLDDDKKTFHSVQLS